MLGPPINGNKARKFFSLLQQPPQQSTIISRGGYQSNAMLALAKLSAHHHKRFIYYTSCIPERLKHTPSGNLQQALELGMEIIETSSFDASRIQQEDSLFIRQGGAEVFAKEGMRRLSQEIVAFCQKADFKHMGIYLSSGTGTSAFYLACHLDSRFTIYTTACVGNSDYLKKQMSKLGTIPCNLKVLETRQRYHFAKPHPNLLSIYHVLESQGIAFDLLYDCVMWQAIADNLASLPPHPHLFIHTGGIEGNPTMLERYGYNNLGVASTH